MDERIAAGARAKQLTLMMGIGNTTPQRSTPTQSADLQRAGIHRATKCAECADPCMPEPVHRLETQPLPSVALPWPGITYLPTTVRGVRPYLYLVIDV